MAAFDAADEETDGSRNRQVPVGCNGPSASVVGRNHPQGRGSNLEGRTVATVEVGEVGGRFRIDRERLGSNDVE